MSRVIILQCVVMHGGRMTGFMSMGSDSQLLALAFRFLLLAVINIPLVSSMDQEKVKELLISEDAEMLVQTMLPYASDADEDQSPEEAEQLCKLQILVWSRVMHLTRDDEEKKSTLVQAYHHLGRCWMMLGDNDKAIGQLQKLYFVEFVFLFHQQLLYLLDL